MKTSMLSMILAWAALAGSVALAQAPAGATEVLNDNTYFRYYYTRSPAVVSVESFRAAGKDEPTAKSPRELKMNRQTPPPPADWFSPEFDDRDWPRTSAGQINQHISQRAHTHRVSLRATFAVTDLAMVGDLLLTVNYRGGVVLYLNGAKVTRQDMPAGELTNEMAATLYPNDAWVTPDGKAISEKIKTPQRDRALVAFKLPVASLRKGTNVLAVELWRSDYHPVSLNWMDWGHPPTFARWVPFGVGGLKLTVSGAGIVPNTGRGKGFGAWAQDRNEFVTGGDYRDPNEASYPVKIVGARNGSYCGQIGVGSDEAIGDLKVAISDFKHTQSASATIPAARVAFLYGQMNKGGWCDNLLDAPPAEVPAVKGRGAVLGVLFRCQIPANATPGEYRAELTVSAAGAAQPVRIPVELYVADWAMPDPKDFRTFASIYQSPESVARQYHVDLWSEEHWKLLEKSWELLGRAGNRVVIVHAVEQTQFGNDTSTIYWIKKPDGSYDWDFTVFDRYVGLAAKACGRLDHVALQVCHVGNIANSNSGWAGNPLDQAVKLTVKGPAGGKPDAITAPAFDSAEARAFWKPFLAAVSSHLDKLGLKDTLCLGILMDVGPSPVLVKMFDDVWPGLPSGGPSKWMRGCHVSTNATQPYPVVKGSAGVVVLHEYCYGGGVKNPKLGEARGYPGAYYFRNSIPEENVALSSWLSFADYCVYLYGGTKGIGRICLDYWPVARGADLFNRFPYSDCMQRRPTINRLSWPGPKGAMPTARLEALIEGIQDCEAVIAVSDALEKNSDQFAPALASRCKRVLEDRRTYIDLVWTELENRSEGWSVTHPYHLGWLEIRKRLYDAAAEVAAAQRLR